MTARSGSFSPVPVKTHTTRLFRQVHVPASVQLDQSGEGCRRSRLAEDTLVRSEKAVTLQYFVVRHHVDGAPRTVPRLQCALSSWRGFLSVWPKRWSAGLATGSPTHDGSRALPPGSPSSSAGSWLRPRPWYSLNPRQYAVILPALPTGMNTIVRRVAHYCRQSRTPRSSVLPAGRD